MRSGGLAGVEGCAKAGNTVVVWASDNYSVRQTATTGHFFGRSMFDRKRTGKPGVISCGRLPCSAASKAKPPGRIFGEAQRIGILRKKLVMADLKAHLNPAVWWRNGCRFTTACSNLREREQSCITHDPEVVVGRVGIMEERL